jgi:hypothetical protein
MDVSDLLAELYGRIGPLAARAVDGLDSDQLARSPAPGANTIGWLIWHLARVQDHHVAELLETEQLWVTDGWAGRFGLDPDPADIGYGHDQDQMAGVRPDGPELLVDYLAAVQDRTDRMLASLTGDQLDRIVDRRWDPPVSLGVRLVSVADDSLQHVGQARYLRGLFAW